jgi:hypothetical protein
VASKAFETAYEGWLQRVQAQSDGYYEKSSPSQVKPKFEATPDGQKYRRVIRNDGHGGRSAYAFIDLQNGDVLKPDSYARPAKHARGNIFSGELGVGVFGAKTLR